MDTPINVIHLLRRIPATFVGIVRFDRGQDCKWYPSLEDHVSEPCRAYGIVSSREIAAAFAPLPADWYGSVQFIRKYAEPWRIIVTTKSPELIDKLLQS